MSSVPISQVTKDLIKANALRVIELLDDPETFNNSGSYSFYNAKKPELKMKMHELRRDTMRLEKNMKVNY